MPFRTGVANELLALDQGVRENQLAPIRMDLPLNLTKRQCSHELKLRQIDTLSAHPVKTSSITSSESFISTSARLNKPQGRIFAETSFNAIGVWDSQRKSEWGLWVGSFLLELPCPFQISGVNGQTTGDKMKKKEK